MRVSTKPKYIVAFDPSSDFGWCIIKIENGKIEYLASGVLCLNDFHRKGQALFALENLIKKLCSYRSIEMRVVYENIVFQGGGVKVGQQYGRIVGTIEKVCYEKGIKIDHIAPTRARKYAVEKGNMQKPEVRHVLEKRFGTEFSKGDIPYKRKKLPPKKQFDESDAVCIAVGYAIYNGLAN